VSSALGRRALYPTSPPARLFTSRPLPRSMSRRRRPPRPERRLRRRTASSSANNWAGFGRQWAAFSLVRTALGQIDLVMRRSGVRFSSRAPTWVPAQGSEDGHRLHRRRPPLRRLGPRARVADYVGSGGAAPRRGVHHRPDRAALPVDGRRQVSLPPTVLALGGRRGRAGHVADGGHVTAGHPRAACPGVRARRAAGPPARHGGAGVRGAARPHDPALVHLYRRAAGRDGRHAPRLAGPRRAGGARGR
jgi:hypothetical protein